MGIIAIAVLGLLTALSGGLALGEATREHTLALTATRQKIEELRAVDFDSLLTSFHAATVVGPTFDVTGLKPVAGEHHVGRVRFLTEAETQAEYSLTNVDIDLDGTLNEAEAANSDFKYFPVKVIVRWHGNTGDRKVELSTIIYNMGR
jgi:hypothetical protein